MSFAPPNSDANFVDPSLYLPEDDKQSKNLLRDRHFDSATAINNREISLYPLTEIICGNQIFTSNPQKYRGCFRKTFQLPATVAGATATINHEISGAVLYLRIFGTATTASDFRPIPHASNIANTNIEIRVTSTQISVINGTASPNITGGIIVLEYTKQSN